jgi:hypothetical protein
MKRILPLLCALVGLLVGGVGAYIAGAEHTPSTPAPHRPADTAVAPTEPKPPAAAPATVEKPAPAANSETQDGSGVIHGTVKVDSNALADVLVRAVPMHEHETDPAETIEQFARRRAQEKDLERFATTDELGAYRVTGLQEGEFYEITPFRAGYTFRVDRDTRTTHFRASSEVNFLATGIVRVTADLRLPDGSQPLSAQLVLNPTSKGQRRYWSWNPVDVSQPIVPGEYEITVKAGEFEEYSADNVTLSARHGEPAHLKIDLRADAGIVGRVIPAPGMESRLSIYLLEPENGKLPDAPPGQDHNSPIPSRRSGGGTTLWQHSHYQFAFLDKQPGPYRLMVVHGNSVVATQDVTVANELVRVDITVPDPDAANYIVVRVAGPEGPISSVLGIHLSFIQGNGSSSGGTAVLNRGGGEFWVARDESKFTGEGGSYEILVKVPKYGSRTIAYTRGDTRVVDVVFSEPAYLTVEIVGYDTHPQRDSLGVSAATPGVQHGHERMKYAEAMKGDFPPGQYRFGPLEPGEYTVTLHVGDGGRHRSTTLSTVEVRVVPGENRAQVTPPTLYSVTIVVPEEHRKSQLGIMRVDDRSVTHYARRANQAEVEFNHLLPGEYWVRAAMSGEMRITLPQPGQKVRFDPKPYNCLRLWRQKEGSVDVGLKPGDCVIEIDGNLMDDHSQRWKNVGAAARKESSTWVVIRDGARVPVTFDGRDWNLTGLSGDSAYVE